MFVVHIFNKKKKEEYVSSDWMEKVALDWFYNLANKCNNANTLLI